MTALARPGREQRGRPRTAVSAPPGERADARPAEGVLTERELEVLDLMAEGATNAEIAEALVISESTTKSHVKNILRKLSVRNRTQAVARHVRGY